MWHTPASPRGPILRWARWRLRTKREGFQEWVATNTMRNHRASGDHGPRNPHACSRQQNPDATREICSGNLPAGTVRAREEATAAILHDKHSHSSTLASDSLQALDDWKGAKHQTLGLPLTRRCVHLADRREGGDTRTSVRWVSFRTPALSLCGSHHCPHGAVQRQSRSRTEPAGLGTAALAARVQHQVSRDVCACVRANGPPAPRGTH